MAAAVGPAWIDHDLVFPRANGSVRYVESARTTLAAACTAIGMPRLRFHDLRHLHATLMIALGVHPRVIQGRLGHARIGTTIDVYGHRFEGADRAAAQAVGALLTAQPK